jgi:hypothetical protein
MNYFKRMHLSPQNVLAVCIVWILCIRLIWLLLIRSCPYYFARISHPDPKERGAHVRLPALHARVVPGTAGAAGGSHGRHLRAVRNARAGKTSRGAHDPPRGMPYMYSSIIKCRSMCGLDPRMCEEKIDSLFDFADNVMIDCEAERLYRRIHVRSSHKDVCSQKPIWVFFFIIIRLCAL